MISPRPLPDVSKLLVGRLRSRSAVEVVVVLIGWFFGLCTVFALVAMAAGAWNEHTQAKWPQATARVQKCSVELYVRSTGHHQQSYLIDCRITYEASGDPIAAKLSSRRVRTQAWPDPSPTILTMRRWVDEHPPGTTISVHYDPVNPQNAVLVETDMPLAGPLTPSNLKVLGFFATIWVVLLTIGRIMRWKSANPNA
jgi:hypothetical protein